MIFGMVAVLGFVWTEMHKRALRTRVLQIPGGLRFEAQDFSVQILRKEQEVQVRCKRGVLTPPAQGDAQEVIASEPESTNAATGTSSAAAHAFAAIGFSLGLRESPGYVDIVMRGADDTQLVIAHVNATVAASFELFYLQVRLWIDKLEQRAQRERVQR